MIPYKNFHFRIFIENVISLVFTVFLVIFYLIFNSSSSFFI